MTDVLGGEIRATEISFMEGWLIPSESYSVVYCMKVKHTQTLKDTLSHI